MKFKLYTVAIALVAFAACSDDAEESNDDGGAEGAVEATPATNASTPPTELQLNSSQQLGNPADAAQPVNGTLNVNPAHGQPGHRCDIPVGAPLDAPPAAEGGNTTITTGNDAVVQPIQGAPAGAPAAASSGNVNPAHGQPGHDCSVPVGAPLPAN